MEISLKLPSIGADKNLIGMGAQINGILSSLNAFPDEFCMIGIMGMGGIGKTTLARAVFDQISFQFEGKSFVANVREVSKPDFGLKKLQQQVLRDVSNDQCITINNVFDGKNMMKKKMPGRKVLVVLDDVDHIDQLKALAGEPNWFKPGSKIIITTRDKQVLLAHKVNLIHDVNLLTDEEAICLLSSCAFRTGSPILGYEELTKKVVRYAAGLPLTITVLGSSLCETNEHKLELSYMGLDTECKQIFLDVACILKGWSKDEVIKVLESRGFHAIHGLNVLEKKSLVTTRDGCLDMHDRIEEMVRYIVRSLHPDDPNRHSRLWITEEIKDILANNQDTEATCLKLFTSLEINQEAVMKGLEKMEKLKLLFVYISDIFGYWKLDEVQHHFPNSLQYLEWSYYPFYSLPKTFQASNLVALTMHYSRMELLQEGGERKVFGKLRFLDLRCSKLKSFDLGLAPNLETLDLERCNDLVELEIRCECPQLKSLNLSSSKLRSLNLCLTPNIETLNLQYSKGLVKLDMPREFPQLKFLRLNCPNLRHFNLGPTPNVEALKLKERDYWAQLGMFLECPQLESLELWIMLRTLDLGPTPNFNTLKLDLCYRLVNLRMHDECCKLKSLCLPCPSLKTFDLGPTRNFKALTLAGNDDLVEQFIPVRCPQLEYLKLIKSELRTFELTLNLKTLILEDHDLVELHIPDGDVKLESLAIERCSKLKTLDLRRTPNLESICLEECSSLVKLCIPNGGVKMLINLKGHLSTNLPKFEFECSYTEDLRSSIGNIEKLISEGFFCACTDLGSFFGRISGLQHLTKLTLEGNITELPKDLDCLQSLEELTLESTKIKHLPDSICMLKHLKSLKLYRCKLLEKLPEDLNPLECLETLELNRCTALRDIPNNICRMKSLRDLSLYGCNRIEELPEELGRLECLVSLDIRDTCINNLPRSILLLKKQHDLASDLEKFAGWLCIVGRKMLKHDPSTIPSMASSSTSSIRNCIFKYDVFLSFRGEDTRKTFVGHLYDALTREGIVTYKDDVDLDQGEIISKELIQAIEDSRFHVIVFSKDYASSSWCLQELTKIMECQNRTTKQTVYPIFYHVEPTEVRNQIGEFGKAFAKHEKAKAAQKWRDALVQAASFSGWDLETIANGEEVEFIKIVVNKISLKIPSIGAAEDNLIGMRTRINGVLSSINVVPDEIFMIGIWGMGGGGKTTLARAVFDQICTEFEGSSFVENVRERSDSRLLGLKSLQQQLLRDVFKKQDIFVNGVLEGKKEIKRKLCCRKVLIVLDDVDNIKQLKALAGDRTWFKKGSVIIITTRDEQVLRSHDVEPIQVNLLSNEEALPLFCMNAFGTEVPVQGYEELSQEVVGYAAGLPLTITVLGSHLRGRSTCGWKGVLKSLKRMPKKEVVDILELSYTSLEDNIKEIFLDVACMGLYPSIDELVIFLESCGHFEARCGLDVLKEKSLITIPNDGEKVVMHDQIVEMGKDIVRRSHRKEPHKHSHLWETLEIEHILANELGTEATECICYFPCELSSELFMKGLRKMKELRYLFAYTKSHNGYCFSGDWEFDEVTKYIPNSLQCLLWSYYPFSCLPKTFQANNLVMLAMENSEIVQLWEGGEKKILKKLKYLYLQNSKLKTLDGGMTPYLVQLYLEGCQLHIPAKWPKLKSFNLHDSKLRTLDLQGAQNLENLDVRGCDSLEELHIHSNCLKLRSIDIMGAKLMTFKLGFTPNLKMLRLAECSHLVELQAPEDLGLLECLEVLILSECTVLRDTPNSICKMKRLEYFLLRNCVAVEKLPEELGCLKCLKELNIEGTNIRHLPQSIFELKGLLIVGFRRLLESFGFTSEIQTSEDEEGETFCYIELGEDTRKNFVDHLYFALERKGIHTYKDDERIKKGKRISDELIKSIEDSRFYVIVFSKTYASSSWCLDELVKIMECQKTTEQTAYPVFYDVEPTEVRKQSGEFGQAFAKHERKEAAEKWREALEEAAALAGWELKNTTNGHEAKFIQRIVEEISLELRSINCSVDGNLIGMQTRIKGIVSSLKMGSDDVRMIGIKGMGGSGKTTLARAVFDQISFGFEGKSFVENIREVSSEASLSLLQKQVLSDVLNDQGINVSSVYDGKKMMKKMMCGRKVLIVLDDVDHIDQLEALVGEPNWFKPGSRIIITTRDEQVLVAHRVNLICDSILLLPEEAICLFSRYAFGREVPIQGYEELSAQVVRYAAGLPLTIKVLGSFLCGKNEILWKDTLERLKTIPLKETLEKLELSYNGLEKDYQEIFLDVVCILKGWRKEEAIRVLESCGFHARIGLRVLEQKSLITISTSQYDEYDYEYLSMHDHIEEMGKNIVRRLHPEEPNRHSRLWIDKEIRDILANDMDADTRCLQIMTRGFEPKIVMQGLGKMKKLRFLHVFISQSLSVPFGVNWIFDDVSQYFPNALRYLSWKCYPFWCLPKTFQANNLVELEMPFSRMVQLWEHEDKKILDKLRFLDLSSSRLMTLDLRLTPNLEVLNLGWCESLVELQMPFECPKLKSINLKFSELKHFDLRLTPNLEMLNLERCKYLVELHMPLGCPKLKSLCLNHSKLRTLNLGQTPNLETLSLENCCDLVELNMPVRCLKLTSLSLSCPKLRTLTSSQL
ncbi:hypothetical protein OSB04_018019 [Centaurea solstitialis]|uniref:TIR domain-containing protein n=1 Tax=Centaurea solstitialis TaxID=347529 RepID=A0AA38T5N6_9ASTR|nr:hypothetical protein OSB04_018019 [Centaurea solstitialis]